MNKRSVFSLKLAGIGVAGLSLFLSAPAVRAGDCGQDPVYERNMSGVTIMGARIRDIACMDGSEVLGVAPSGARVKIIAETDGWYKVAFGETVGWMGSRLVRATNAYDAADDIAAIKKETKKTVIAKAPYANKMIGISERDFSRLKIGNASLRKKLKGKIILRAQARGQAYFVETDGSLTHLASKKQMKEYAEQPVSSNGKILLSGHADGNDVALLWSLSGMESSKGFKVVKSTEPNPVYPGDAYHYLSDASAESDTWTGLESGQTYHFRVCEYLGGRCGVYSNNVRVTIP